MKWTYYYSVKPITFIVCLFLTILATAALPQMQMTAHAGAVYCDTGGSTCVDDQSTSSGILKIYNNNAEIDINAATGYFKDIWNKSLNYHYKKLDSGDWPYKVSVGQIADIYEAEYGTLGGTAAILNDCAAFCSNGQEVAFGNGSGNYVQFNNIIAPTTGNYNVTLSYLDGDAANVTRTATMVVNGGTPQTVTFDGLGNWDSAKEHLPITIPLNAGSSNTIKFYNSTGWGPIFDKISVVPVTPVTYDAEINASSPFPQTVSSYTHTVGADYVSLTVNYMGTSNSGLVDSSDGTSTNVTLSYTITVYDPPAQSALFNQNEYFKVKATVTNHNTAASDIKITGLYAGIGGELTADGTTGWTAAGVAAGSRTNETMAVPDWNMGEAIANPHSLSSAIEYGYPGTSSQDLSLGWIDLYSTNGTDKGLGMGYINDAGMTMDFSIGSSGSGSSIEWKQFDLTNAPSGIMANSPNMIYGLEPGNSWTTGNWIIAPHSGDWHTLADSYRTVYYTDMTGYYTPASDYPSNFSNIWYQGEPALYMVDNIGLGSYVADKATTLESNMQYYADTAGADLQNYLVNVVGYNGNNSTSNPLGGHGYGFPAYTAWGNPAGTPTEIQNMFDDLAADNATTSFYIDTMEDSPNADNILANSYKPDAASGYATTEYQTSQHVPAADTATDDWLNLMQNIGETFRGDGLMGIKFDQLPLLSGITTNTHAARTIIPSIDPTTTLGKLQSDIAGRRYILDHYFWNETDATHPTAWKPFISSESGDDVTGGRNLFWGWNGGGPPKYIYNPGVLAGTQAVNVDGLYTRFTFPEKYVSAYSDQLGINMARLQLAFSGGGGLYTSYNTFRSALSSNSAPGVPFHFQDNIGLSDVPSGLNAYAFADSSAGVTVTFYTTKEIDTTIHVDMRKYSSSYSASSVAVQVNMPANQFGFAIINSSGTVTTSWFGNSYEAEAAGNTLNGLASSSSRTIDSGGAEVGSIGNGSLNTLTINNVNVGTSGTYMVAISYLNGDASARTAVVSVNSGALNQTTTVSFPGFGNWSTIGSVVVPMTLTAGNNTIEFSNASAYTPNIDKITVQNITGTEYEAESGTNTYNGSAVSSSNGAVSCSNDTGNTSNWCSGGVEVGPIGLNANTLTFNNINVGTTGTYYLGFVYTNGMLDGNNNPAPLNGYISVNGGNNQVVSFSGLGSWNGIMGTTITVSLNAGNNTIAISNPNASSYAPNIDKIIVSPIGGQTYEAEAVSPGGTNTLSGTAAVFSCSCSNGNGVGWTHTSDSMTFNSISAPSTGVYRMVIAYQNGDASARTGKVSVNGTAIADVNFPSTGSWPSAPIGTVTVPITLNSGSSNYITIGGSATAFAPNIDNITILPIPLSSRYPGWEAEWGFNSLVGSAAVAKCSFCSSGREVGFIGNGSGNNLTINHLIVPTSGIYDIDVTYLNGDTVGTSRQAAIYVNGSLIPVYNFPALGNWDTESTVILTSVALNAGDNSIEFANTNPGVWAPNIDKITLK